MGGESQTSGFVHGCSNILMTEGGDVVIFCIYEVVMQFSGRRQRREGGRLCSEAVAKTHRAFLHRMTGSDLHVPCDAG